jgi:hypothetical protein
MERLPWTIGLAAGAMIAGAIPAGAASQGERDGPYYVDGDGAAWAWRENRRGAVLRHRTTYIYLGRDCGAYARRFGRGRWGWANGGVLITFPRRRIGFARQDPPVRRGSVRCDL